MNTEEISVHLAKSVKDLNSFKSTFKNINGISDQEGILYDQKLIHMKDAEASIFVFNEIHGDNMNSQTLQC